MNIKIIKHILSTLEEYYDDTGMTLGEFIYHPYKMLYGDLKKLYPKDSLSHAISRAERKGLVKKLIDKQQVYIALTALGKEESAKVKEGKGLALTFPKADWDGRYRLVIFDIPEESRVIRDTLRYKLKEFGLVGWQKSVWITKENITKAFRKFLKENSLEDYILVIETRDLGNKKLERLLSRNSRIPRTYSAGMKRRSCEARVISG